MSFDLPTLPRRASVDFIEVSAGGDLQGALGGSTIRINRLGDKTGVSVSLPGLAEPCAGVWRAALLRGKSEMARLALPVFADLGDPGDPVVDGGGQAGMELDLKGLTAGYVVPVGTPFSIVQAGVRYLHFTTAQATADGSGDVTLTIAPMLRVSPANEAVVEMAQPIIEGWIQKGENAGWSQAWTGIQRQAFTLIEAK